MKYLWITTLACAGMLQGNAVQAQEPKRQRSTGEEKVVIRKDPGQQTIIEIREGSVWIDGEKMSSPEDKTSSVQRKIIIENSPGGFGGKGWQASATPRKVMLGVITNPSRSQDGAYVERVSPNSPAAAIGLREGDVITGIGQEKIASAGDLVAAVATHEPGDKVKVSYRREGKTLSSEVELAPVESETPGYGTLPFAPGMGEDGDMPNALFRSLPFLQEGLAPAPKLGIAAEDRTDGNGVSVLEVKPGSPAATAGLKEQDVITRFNDGPVGSVEDLQQSVRSAPANEKIKVEYQRAGKKLSTELVLPKPLRRKDL